MKKQREKVHINDNQVALVIMDVFKGQMTPSVCDLLNNSSIKVKPVPPNMTHYFQPQDAQGSTNQYSKGFMKRKFSEWYSSEVVKQIDAGHDVDTIDIPLKLSIMKPLHATWIIELYNYFTSPRGTQICLKGWEVTGNTCEGYV